jgi:hypothetical protein
MFCGNLCQHFSYFPQKLKSILDSCYAPPTPVWSLGAKGAIREYKPGCLKNRKISYSSYLLTIYESDGNTHNIRGHNTPSIPPLGEQKKHHGALRRQLELSARLSGPPPLCLRPCSFYSNLRDCWAAAGASDQSGGEGGTWNSTQTASKTYTRNNSIGSIGCICVTN